MDFIKNISETVKDNSVKARLIIARSYIEEYNHLKFYNVIKVFFDELGPLIDNKDENIFNKHKMKPVFKSIKIDKGKRKTGREFMNTISICYDKIGETDKSVFWEYIGYIREFTK